MQEPTSLVTRAEQLYGAHADGDLVSRERLEQLCREHEVLAPCLRQIDYVQRFLADTALDHEPAVPGYRIERRIGQGGMGTVFAAYHEQLDRLVALKLGPASHTEDVGARERFLREARALAQVSHRHVVPIYDVMSHAEGSALAMELVVGADLAAVAKALGAAAQTGTSPADALADLLGDRCTDPWPGTVTFLLGVANQIAQALSAVHAAGLLHRDVKPSNIMVRAGERTALALLEFDAAGARAEAALAMRLDPALSGYLGPLSIEALISQGDTEHAASALQLALEREPASPALQLVAAQLATARGDDAAAVRACEAALALAPDCVPALARLAEIQWRSDPQAATTHLERLTEMAPFLPQPHQNLGRLHYTAKQFERARDHLARAVALDPRDGVSLCMLGECQFHLRDEACEITLAAAARLLGRNARPHYFLSRELHRNGDLEGAIAAAETALGHIESGDSSVREESVRNALAQLRRLRGR